MPKADRFAQSRKAQPLAALQRRPIFCNKKHPKSEDFRCFLSGVDRKDAGAKSCAARVCGLLRLDFPFCNSNPQHLVMTDE